MGEKTEVAATDSGGAVGNRCLQWWQCSFGSGLGPILQDDRVWRLREQNPSREKEPPSGGGGGSRWLLTAAVSLRGARERESVHG